jgi:hypothetical protein
MDNAKKDSKSAKITNWFPLFAKKISWGVLLTIVGFIFLIFLFFFRYPTFFYPQAYNPDEAQFASAAISAVTHPIPYEKWDPSTSGPLNIFPLLLPLAFGQEITLASGRIVATLALAVVSTFIFGFLARTIGFASALIGTIPFLAFHCTTANPDFVHYSSEMVPNAFLALGIFFTSFQIVKSTDILFTIASGASFACAPLAKWQTGPLAVWLFLISAVMVACRFSTRQQRFRVFLGYFIGGIFVVSIALLFIFVPGNAEYFYAVVVKLGSAYAGMKSPSFMDRVNMIHGITLSSEAFLSMLIGVVLAVLLLGALGLFFRFQHRKFNAENSEKSDAFALIIVFAWLLGAFGTLFSTGRDYLHYLLLAAPPLSATVGTVFYWATSRQTEGRVFTFATMVVAVLIWPVLVLQESSPKHLINTSGAILSHSSKILNKLKIYGDRLAVWGCYSEVYIESKMPYGVRSYSVFTMGNIPEENNSWFRKEYLDFFKTNKPEWFLDATFLSLESMIGQQPDQKRYESFPELKKEVDANYKFMAITDEGRLFIRKDLLGSRASSVVIPDGSLKELANSTSVPAGSVRRWKSGGTTSMAILPNGACVIEIPAGSKFYKFEALIPNEPIKVFTRWAFQINEYANPKVLTGDNLEALNLVKNFSLRQSRKEWQEIEGELPNGQKLLVIFLPAEKIDKPTIAAIRNLEFFDLQKAKISQFANKF